MPEKKTPRPDFNQMVDALTDANIRKQFADQQVRIAQLTAERDAVREDALIDLKARDETIAKLKARLKKLRKAAQG